MAEIIDPTILKFAILDDGDALYLGLTHDDEVTGYLAMRHPEAETALRELMQTMCTVYVEQPIEGIDG